MHGRLRIAFALIVVSLVPGLQISIHDFQTFAAGKEAVPAAARAAQPAEAAASPPPEAPPPELPPELSPYRVRVSVTFDADPLLGPAFRARILREIPLLSGRTFGQMWSLDVAEHAPIRPAGPAGLSRLSQQDLLKQFEPEGLDNVFFLVVAMDGTTYRVWGRAWEQKSQTLGAMRSVETYERRGVADAAFALVRDLFQPVAVLGSATQDTATVRIRAGEFPAPDPDAAQFRKGDLLRPLLRFFNRERELVGIQPVPWTYLTVENIDRARASCSVATGLRAPLARTASRRVDAIALRLRPQPRPTRVSLVTRTNPPRPLIGYKVDLYLERPSFRPAEKATPPPEPAHLLSDRWGNVTVDALAAHPLVWLYVKSGGLLLGRVPIVPGVEAAKTLELPDDSLRLSVEGDLSLLQQDLVDVVARRAVLASLARSYAREKKWDLVTEETNRLAELPGQEAFTSRLTSIRVPAVDAARSRRDRASELRILKLCDQTMELIKVYLDVDKIHALEEELRELRELGKAQ